jgi:RNA polymerase sigma factor (sigma-70 family)
VEDLEDSEYHLGDFLPVRPTGYFEENPEKQLQKEEEVRQVAQVLCRLPEKEQIVFELSAVEGFSNDAVAQIARVQPDEVPRIVRKIKEEMRRELEPQKTQRKAS